MIQKTILTLTVLHSISLLVASPTQTPDNIENKNLAIYHATKGNVEKQYNSLIEKKLKSIGFRLANSGKKQHDNNETKWNSTTLDVVSLPIIKDSAILPLLNIEPRIAGFSPFNLVMHKKFDENASYIGHLVPEVMLDILGIKDKKVRNKFSSSFKALDAITAQELGGDEKIMPYNKLAKQTMLHFQYNFDTPKDMHVFIDKFQKEFELAFTNEGYLVSGFYDFMRSSANAEKILSNYEAFWNYSLNHLEFSYDTLGNEGARPEAALFVPFNIYMYIPKGENKIVLGMVKLLNCSNALGINNEKRLSLVKKIDTSIPKMLTKLGMKEITIVHASNKVNTKTNTVQIKEKPLTKHAYLLSDKKPKAVAIPQATHKKMLKKQKLVKIVKKPSPKQNEVQHIKVANTILGISIPKVPKVPNVQKCASSTLSVNADRSIKFSKRTPPNYTPHSFDKKQNEKVSTRTGAGEINKGKVSAHLRGAFMEVAKVKDGLKAAGFEVIATVPINKNESLVSVVFTDKSLVSMASEPIRGFMASLRVLVDTEAKTISITNPIYMAKGFLQDAYNDKEANKLLARLIKQFPNLRNSKDSLKFQLLPNYQFMNGMPKYQDMIEVASGSALLEKIKDNKKVLFTQTLNNGSTLIGIQLSKRTAKFIRKIGRKNAAMLPYPILIEDGKAKILDPKFYISYMYPELTMSEFMTIASIPDAIIKDCEKVFKKKR